MRQYEYSNCIEKNVKKGQVLEIGSVNITSGCCDADLTLVFANPKTNNIVWIPYGSRISIENKLYNVIQGEVFHGRNSRCFSSECLLDERRELHDLNNYKGKQAIFLE